MKLLLRSVTLSILLLSVPVLTFAANKKSLTINEPISVAGTVLQPGDYRLEWDGTGSNVQVKFIQNNKTIVTAPATVETKSTSYDGALDLRNNGDKAKALREIDFKNTSIVFEQSASAAGD